VWVWILSGHGLCPANAHALAHIKVRTRVRRARLGLSIKERVGVAAAEGEEAGRVTSRGMREIRSHGHEKLSSSKEDCFPVGRGFMWLWLTEAILGGAPGAGRSQTQFEAGATRHL
jgi:hypothetical protein